eukprot:1933998-Amphidinium_carterae.1
MESRLCVTDNSMSEFDMVAELALALIEMEDNRNNDAKTNEKNDKNDNTCNREDEDNEEYDGNEENMQTLNIYKMEEGTIDCTKAVTAIVLGDRQDKYTATEVNRVITTYPPAVAEGEDGYDDYMDLRDNIRKMRDEIVSFSQTLRASTRHKGRQ